MATESVAERLNHISASIDGVASLLQEMVQSTDLEVSRQAFALADLCERNSQELGAIATALGRDAQPLATERVNQTTDATAGFAASFEKGEEAALLYVEAALEAHRKSFGGNEEETRKMQWAVTGLLERALQLLNADVYGEA